MVGSSRGQDTRFSSLSHGFESRTDYKKRFGRLKKSTYICKTNFTKNNVVLINEESFVNFLDNPPENIYHQNIVIEGINNYKFEMNLA